MGSVLKLLSENEPPVWRFPPGCGCREVRDPRVCRLAAPVPPSRCTFALSSGIIWMFKITVYHVRADVDTALQVFRTEGCNESSTFDGGNVARMMMLLKAEVNLYIRFKMRLYPQEMQTLR